MLGNEGNKDPSVQAFFKKRATTWVCAGAHEVCRIPAVSTVGYKKVRPGRPRFD